MGVVGDATVIRLRLSSDDVVDELYYSTISGYILDGDGDPVDADVFLTGDETVPGAPTVGGLYQFFNVLNGSYTVTPAKAGRTFYPDHQDIAVSGADVVVDTMIEVWVVSGYIVDEFDAGIEDVTVALSGDESGSTTTDAHGFYSFSNIPNGSYTVTPAKADLEFTPDHQDITVVDADEVVTDMVGDSIHYTISGYILDGDSAGIEGVTVTDTPLWAVAGVLLDAASDPVVGATVTLSGDASDTDTTDANGAYSFLLPDGSYTITPTLTDYTFTEDHEDVTVAGDDVVVDTMVGDASPYLTLPYTYNMSDVAPSSGGVAAQLADWGVTAGGVDGSITTSVVDSNTYTPAGVSKGFYIPWGATQAIIVHALAKAIDPSLTSLRMAHLFFSGEELNPAALAMSSNSSITGNSQLAIILAPSFNPDGANTYSRYEAAASVNDIGGAVSGNTDSRRYYWHRLEYDFVAETVMFTCVRHEDSAAIYSKAYTMHPNGVTLGHVPTGLQYLRLMSHYGSTTPTVVKFWIGTAADAWPT